MQELASEKTVNRSSADIENRAKNAKAKAFSSDLVALDKIRQGLRPRVLASRLFDAKAFARDLEDAFQGMWRKWCEEQATAKRA